MEEENKEVIIKIEIKPPQNSFRSSLNTLILLVQELKEDIEGINSNTENIGFHNHLIDLIKIEAENLRYIRIRGES